MLDILDFRFRQIVRFPINRYLHFFFLFSFCHISEINTIGTYTCLISGVEQDLFRGTSIIGTYLLFYEKYINFLRGGGWGFTNVNYTSAVIIIVRDAPVSIYIQ